MKTWITLSIGIFICCFAMAQSRLRPLEELINTADSGWPIVNKWIDSATNKVEILNRDSIKSGMALLETQVTTRSPMGAIIYHTGGLLIDDGWIRILGSDNPRLQRDLPGWNQGKAAKITNQQPGFLLVADDAIGGFFLLNGGSLGNDPVHIYYFSPDNLQIEPLGITYSGFLDFCFRGNLEEFYSGSRWKNWQAEVAQLPGDKVFNFYPPQWAKEGKNLAESSRKIISIEEQYQLNIDFKRQLETENPVEKK